MMRAGVFIGVDGTGSLQKLSDAAAGAKRMHAWALAQGMPDNTHAKLITDEGGKRIRPDLIYDAIKEIIDGPGVDQLILYFAGHGVNINRSEQWLLTDAPVNTSAAVNMSGSAELARYCGIRHVVMISDACRVAAEGIQASNVRGVDVFPNEGPGDRARPVDQFFACMLGRTAAEIQDPAAAAKGFSALYTNALLDALSGARSEVLDPSDDPTDPARYVKPVRLEEYLELEVPRRVKQMQLEGKVNQNPDAIITAHPNWLARIVLPPTSSPEPPVRRPPALAKSVRSVERALVSSAAQADSTELRRRLEEAKSEAPGAERLAASVEHLTSVFGPDLLDSGCGIKVRGTRIVEFFAPRAQCRVLGPDDDLLVVDAVEGPAASVVLRFKGNVGAVVPAIPEFLAAVTMDEGELVDIAYEPSANTWRWDMFRLHAPEVRTLRAVAASASQRGRFRLEEADAPAVAQRMQYEKSIDPTLSVYAAYAYHDLQATERIRDMSGYQRSDLGIALFDVALLANELAGRGIGADSGVVPFVPLLGQGWSLLRAHRIDLHAALDGLDKATLDSLWSLYSPSGVDMLKAALATGRVR